MRRCGPLSEEEKQRQSANRLCLYCGGPGHITINCPHTPRRQVNLIVLIVLIAQVSQTNSKSLVT